MAHLVLAERRRVDVGVGLADVADPFRDAGLGVEAGDVGGRHLDPVGDRDVDVPVVGDGRPFERGTPAAGPPPAWRWAGGSPTPASAPRGTSPRPGRAPRGSWAWSRRSPSQPVDQGDRRLAEPGEDPVAPGRQREPGQAAGIRAGAHRLPDQVGRLPGDLGRSPERARLVGRPGVEVVRASPAGRCRRSPGRRRRSGGRPGAGRAGRGAARHPRVHPLDPARPPRRDLFELGPPLERADVDRPARDPRPRRRAGERRPAEVGLR